MSQKETSRQATETLTAHKYDDLATTNDSNPTSDGQALSLDEALADRLCAEHLDELRKSAVSDEVITDSGVFTAYEKDQLPEPLQWIADREGALPALVHPLTEVGVGDTWQVKPQPGAVVFADGRSPKYICPSKDSGYPAPSFIVRRAVDAGTRRVLLVEGTKQSLAALTWTDEGTAVYGLTGITSWMGGQAGPNPAFQLVKDLPVYIAPDADAARNRQVYDGACALGGLCMSWGASVVRYLRLPGGGRQGMDDILASVPEEHRSEHLDNWMDRADKKPAAKMPAKSKVKEPTPPPAQSGPNGRPCIYVEDTAVDVVWDFISDAVYNAYGGKTIFRQDGRPVIVMTIDDRPVILPLDPGLTADLTAQAVDIVAGTTPRAISNTDAAVVFNARRMRRYPQINGVAEMPVLAPSGNIISSPGFDSETGLYVQLAPELEGFSIPDTPTQQQVADALAQLEDVLVDFPFRTEADRTRALSILFTLLMRPATPTVPMTVLSANTPGSGKGLLAEVMSRLALGIEGQVQKMPEIDSEMQKVLVTCLLKGKSLQLFDEASAGIDSSSLAALLTASYYGGRILGESREVNVKNNMTIVATGNNVPVSGDLGRRVVLVEMESPHANPEARTGFKHDPLGPWVSEHRRELLEAAFTLIRAWVVAGRPKPTVLAPIGSFEAWYHHVGGVLEFAGRMDLMEGVLEQRRRHNDTEQEDLAHIYWLYQVFKGQSFAAFDVQKAIVDTEGFVPLPSQILSLEDATANRLGRVYAKLQDRNYQGFIIKSSGLVNHIRQFHIEHVGGGAASTSGGGTGPVQPAGGSPASRPSSSGNDAAFVTWLSDTFAGGALFTAADAVGALKVLAPGDVVLPSGVGTLNSLSSRTMGRCLVGLVDQCFATAVVRRGPVRHKTNTYFVESLGGPDGGDFGGPDAPDTPVSPDPVQTAEAEETVVVFDLETGSASDLHVSDDPGFVRLAAFSVNGAEPVTSTDIAGELIPVLENADKIVGHNIVQFDLPALRRFGLNIDKLVEEDRVRDTLVMARLAHPPQQGRRYDLSSVAKRVGVNGKLVKQGESVLKRLAIEHGGFDQIPADNTEYIAYAKQDVAATAAVFNRLLPITLDAVSQDYLTREHQKMHRLSITESKGIRVDAELVDRMIADEEQTRSEIRQWLHDTVGVPLEGKAPESTAAGKEAIAAYLTRFGAPIPRTDKGAVSISATSLQELADAHAGVPEVVELVEKMTTLLQTKSPASTVKQHLRGDRVFPSIQASQATGRLSTTRPGMTIFGSRGERLLKQRAMILPDEGEVLISIDLSQIDARAMAAGAGDAGYAELFQAGRDSHTEMALRVFGDPGRRSDAKALAHAANYGMGPASFAQSAGVSEPQAAAMLDQLRSEFPALEDFKMRLRKLAELQGFITTGFGRKVAIDRSKAWTQAPAAFGQGSARDAFLEGVLALPAEIADMIRIFVHDEVVLSVPPERAEEIKQLVMDAFKSVQLPCANGVSVPVLADSAGPGANWSECH